MESFLVQESCIGLDGLSRSTMKLLVRDVLCLKSVVCTSLNENSALYSFKGHVVNRVEIMGIIVRVDKRDNRHFYAVDDGTGVIECKYWKNSSHDTIKAMSASGLSDSLQQKVEQVQAAFQLKHEEGFDIGDLILVRGCVKNYMGRLEIDVLDHRKIENPCLEYQRILRLPSLYKIYNEPPRLPDSIEKALKSSGHRAFNEESVQIAIIREMQSSMCSHTADSIFTETDVLTWPSVAELMQRDEERNENRASSSGVNPHHDRLAIVQSALNRLEKGRGLLIRRQDSASPAGAKGGTYEIITAHCPLSRHILSVMQSACKNSHRNAEKGLHARDLLSLLNESHNHTEEIRSMRTNYGHVTEQVLGQVLASLETSSDVICLSSQCYLPVD